MAAVGRVCPFGVVTVLDLNIYGSLYASYIYTDAISKQLNFKKRLRKDIL